MASTKSIFSNIPQEVLDILNTEQKALLFDKYIAQSKEKVEQVTFEPTPNKRGKDKSKRKSRRGLKRNVPIYEMINFPKYSTPRVYNSRTGYWQTKNNSKGQKLYLPFESLITLIEDYRNNVPMSETFRKIDTHAVTVQGIKTQLLVYRAGGFNEGIIENARKYGYDPQELISKECEYMEVVE